MIQDIYMCEEGSFHGFQSYEEYCTFQYDIIKNISESKKNLLLAIIQEQGDIQLSYEADGTVHECGEFYFDINKKLTVIIY